MKIKKTKYLLFLFILSFFSIALVSCDGNNEQEENLPGVETGSASEIKTTSAICSAKILDNGNFELLECGICWNTTGNPTLNDSYKASELTEGEYTIEMNDLEPNTTYYVRAYATNETGTAYGKSIDFKTEDIKIVNGPNVTDTDGNVYHSVVIGSQTWMIENLKVTKYNDGSEIQTTTIDNEWNLLTNGGYCWYNNDASANKSTYGAIYNWYAVNTGKLCPKGWHVPSTTEWKTLITYLGGTFEAGGKLKESGTSHWMDPNLASNEAGFTALPGGTRNFFGTYGSLSRNCNFWSSTVPTNDNATFFLMANEHTGISENILNKASGFSVRCIKD